ncbi:UNVERIFIED_CONTAM: hypothetical protein GTU68_063812 [Idotea baltica]|nr:hypothetical protein [Idotea baltica]
MVTSEARNGAEGLECFLKNKHDLIVLDISMPELDGLDVCREIRKNSNVAILFLSSRDDEIDRIVGLELGADDYLTKPFSPREMVARVKAILKRSNNNDTPQEAILNAGDLSIDVDGHRVFWQQTEISLTATEFPILAGMIKHPNMVFSRAQIMDMAYEDNIYVSDRTIDSHIRHIRKKFDQVGCHAIFITIHGVGYRLLK